MRITNSIMQNNTLYNINTNKMSEDKLSTMMSTGKKVAKPSDDPVVAIRALRLHTNVSEVQQYYTYNTSDAESWMKTTQDAMANLTDIIDELYAQAGKASKQDLQSSDIKVILEEMNSLVDEYYSIGNSDYAGRYIFTGYRTDTPLTFQKDTKVTYQITESFSKESIDEIRFTDLQGLENITKTNYSDAQYSSLNEQSISEKSFKRIRLSYDNIEVADPAPTMHITIPDKDEDGVRKNTSKFDVEVVSAKDVDRAYKEFADGDTIHARFIPETGELLIDTEAYETLMALDGGFEFTYEKAVWKEGDLNPEHYFACTQTMDEAGAAVHIEYNGGAGQDNRVSEQKIQYDIGYNQKVQVNTNAYELFNPMMRQDVDDLNAIVKQFETIEKTVKDLEANIGDSGKAVEEIKKAAAGTEIGKVYSNYSFHAASMADYNAELTRLQDEITRVKGLADTPENQEMLRKLEKDKDEVDTTISILNSMSADDQEKAFRNLEKIKDYEIRVGQYDAAKRAYSYVRENVQKMFEHSITRIQGYLDETNLAITGSGTRGARLDLAKNRLMEQKTTYETLQSENEDSDVTEVTVQLKSVQLSYEAALLATSKVIQTTLLNYL